MPPGTEMASDNVGMSVVLRADDFAPYGVLTVSRAAEICLNHAFFMDPRAPVVAGEDGFPRCVIRAWVLRWLQRPPSVAWQPWDALDARLRELPTLHVKQRLARLGSSSFEILYEVFIEGRPLYTLLCAVACAEGLGTPAARAVPAPAWLRQHVAKDLPESLAADRKLMEGLRRVDATGTKAWPLHASWKVRASEEDWWRRHVNFGSYVRRAEDAARAWGWPEDISAMCVAHDSEAFAEQALDVRGDEGTGTVAFVRGNTLLGSALFVRPAADRLARL